LIGDAEKLSHLIRCHRVFGDVKKGSFIISSECS